MRIVIEYTYAICQQEGVARYTRSLVDALTQIDTEDRITLFSTERPRPDRGFPVAPNVRPVVVPIGSRAMAVMWDRIRLPVPIEVFTGLADVIHGPFLLPPSIAMRSILTVHDLSFLTHPECSVPNHAAYLSKAVPRSVNSADHIIAVSEHTARDLVELLRTPRHKISVIHLGVDPMFAPVRDPEQLGALDARYGLQHPFVLAVGTIAPRKNYPGLIAAFAQARRAPNGPRMLVISGRKGWLWDKTFEAVQIHDVADAVRFLDHVPESDLPTLYSTADVLALPSLSEGFGLPVIEAMSCGTPVVCSDGGSLPEIAGDAAIVVSVDNEAALADALMRVVGDAALRETLIARGLQRARLFTWERAARASLEVYSMVTKIGHVRAKQNGN